MRTVHRTVALAVVALVGFAVGCRVHEVAQPIWDYYGTKTGPEHWGALSPAFAVARTGTEQSPIDIVRAKVEPASLPHVRFAYGDAATVELANDGHTVRATLVAGAAAITIGNQTYDVVEFHFHTPSEHTIEGKHLPAELHIVHRSASGSLAVVGVFLTDGETNQALAKLYVKGELPAPATAPRKIDKVDLSGMLPRARTTYRYAGSLTTPPCTEGVAWMVFAEPVPVGTDQLVGLAKLFSGADFPEGNRRPVQPLGARVVRTEE